MSRSVFIAQLLLVISVTIGCSGKTETETKTDKADKNVQAKKQPSRNGDEHQPSSKAEASPTTASTKEKQPSDDTQSPVQPIDLAYLPDGYNVALVFHPQRMLNHPAITPEMRGDVAEAISEVLDQKGLPMLEVVPDIDSLEQVVVMADAQIMEAALDAASRDKSDVKIIGIEEKEGGEFDEFDPGNRNRIPKEELKELDVPPLDLREFRDEKPTDTKDFKPPLVLKLRFREAVDAEKEARRILDQQQIESQDIGGKTYYFSKDALRGCLAIDGRTIVVTPTNVLPKIVDAEADSSDPLKNELRSISRENDFIAAFVVPDHLREQAGTLADSLGKEIPPGFQDLAKLPAGLDAASLQINLSGDTLARLRVKLNDKELANGLASAASKGLDLGKMSLALVNKRESPNPAQELILSLGTDLLKNIKVRQSETLLSISVAAPERFSERVATLMQEAKKAAEATFQANQLKQIGLGLHNHYEVHRVLPPGRDETWYDNEGKPKLSWRVHILPFVEHSNLYDQFRRDEPWDSEHNIKLLDQMPDVYRTTDDPTKTTLMMVVGEGTAYEGKKGHTFSSFSDGLTKTIMVVRAGTDKSVPWTKPEDLAFEPDDPVAAFGEIDVNEIMVLMGDGSVKRLPRDVGPAAWRGLLTRAGGEQVTLPEPTTKNFNVSGKVSFNDGKPLSSGRIVFARVSDGAEGFTHVDADGTYSISKLREGTYTVYFSERDDKGESGKSLPPIRPKYLSPKTSSIQLDLKSDTSFDIVIERP
jgi:hypothetical protein